MTYEPNPVDTTRIQLDDELERLVERLAESAHDNWAQRRIADGWTYGPERNDRDKRHPDLVAYADLPESEKEYDRLTVRETVKGILSLGFRIAGPATE
jgi:ryanodine receptor 2